MTGPAVPHPLRPFVRGIRVVPAPDAPEPQVYRRLPDGATELLVRFGRGQATAALIGTRTRTLHKPATQPAATVLVRFHADGGYPFFGRPMTELTDRVVSVSELWDAPALEILAPVSGAVSATQATCNALLHALHSDTAYEPWSAVVVRQAVRTVLDASALPTVTELASRIGISQRHLRRGFADVVGLSPKRFIRIVRFRRALALARRSPTVEWAAVAEQAGYFDQAHLIHDVRALTGTTPEALVRRHVH